MKSNPSGDTMNWRKITFGVPCCKNAFSTKSTCDLAFCPDCFNTHTHELTKDDKSKKRRLSGRNRGESAAKASKGETGGGCGRHTIEDLRNLSHVESNKTFLASRRKKDMVGYHNIATTCYNCGVEF